MSCKRLRSVSASPVASALFTFVASFWTARSLAIAEESHRVAGDESAVFATILDSDAIKARRSSGWFTSAGTILFRRLL